MRGYEARHRIARALPPTAFRIPMRGYEGVKDISGKAITQVPNPHEGL